MFKTILAKNVSASAVKPPSDRDGSFDFEGLVEEIRAQKDKLLREEIRAGRICHRYFDEGREAAEEMGDEWGCGSQSHQARSGVNGPTG